MITAIDAAGRLVIPKAIRDEAGLVPGEPLEVTVHEGRVEIVPAPRQVRVRSHDGLRIADAVGAYEPLTEPTVRRTRDRLRSVRKRR